MADITVPGSRTVAAVIDDAPITLNESANIMAPNTVSSPIGSNSRDAKTHYPLNFWLLFAALSFSGLVSALDGSIVSTALPSIIESLNGAENYIWVVNVYFLTSAALQPLYGQLADLWGRRWLMITVTAIFLLGSGLCGGAHSMDMLIWARAVQGIGAGGINMLIDLIICDLVPMRARGTFIGLLFIFISIGSAAGPFVGGILTERASWRWIFYINLPIGGLALGLLFAFLHVKHKDDLGWTRRLKRIDWSGNAILICSTFSVLWALTYGGTRYTWSDGHVVTPLVIGLLGLILFRLFEAPPWCSHPVMPPHHFKSLTTVTAFFLTFQNMVLSFWVVYFYPLYFQSVKRASITRSGVNLLPLVLILPLFAGVGGAVVSKWGRYKPVHLFAKAVLLLAIGLSSTLDQNTNTATWATFQVIAGIGLGMILSSTLQAVQAGLPEADVASSVGTWSFIRSLGTIWGVSIPSAIFNNRFDQLSYRIDASVRDEFLRGRAYERATAQFIGSFPPGLRDTIIGVYTDALRRVWQIGIVFAGITFLAVFLEKEIELRKDLETEFGLVEEKRSRLEDVEVDKDRSTSRA